MHDTTQPSSRHPELLPSAVELERLCVSWAALDAILEPEWGYRYYSYDPQWNNGQRLASMRDGSGDSFFVWFGPPGVALKGFAHESPAATAGVGAKILANVPPSFRQFREEPALDMQHTTFCLWNEGQGWKTAHLDFAVPSRPGLYRNDPDGSQELLGILAGDPALYQKFADEYHEIEVPLDLVASIYQHTPMDEKLALSISPERSWAELKPELLRTGYPVE